MKNPIAKKLFVMILALTMLACLLLAAPALAEGAEAADPAGADSGLEDLAAATDVAEAVAAAESAEAAESQEETAESSETLVANEAAKAQKLDATYTLALNAIAKEDYATARKYLNIAFVYCDPQTNPTIYADLLLKQGCIDVIEEDYTIALLELDAALAVDPELADAYLVRTQVYTTTGEYAQAVASLEKYIELTGDVSMYATVAQLYEAMGDAESAQKAYDNIIAQGDADAETRFQAGLYRMDSGMYAEAAELFLSFTEDETYAPAAWYNIGLCRMYSSDYAGAAEAFSAAQEKGFTYDGLQYNLGICNLLQEDYAKAAEYFTASVESESYKDDARYNLAVCEMQLGDYEAAVAAFDELIANFEAAAAENPDVTLNDAVYYFRGACNAALGNLEAAVADYTTCIEHEYELAQSYYQRAQVYEALGDTEKQNADLEKSLQLGN